MGSDRKLPPRYERASVEHLPTRDRPRRAKRHTCLNPTTTLSCGKTRTATSTVQAPPRVSTIPRPPQPSQAFPSSSTLPVRSAAPSTLGLVPASTEMACKGPSRRQGDLQRMEIFSLEGGGRRLEREGSTGSLHCYKVRTVLCATTGLSFTDGTELGINLPHIRAKSLAVLNPILRVDEHIMDDADLAGPLLFIICFGTFLLFVRTLLSQVARFVPAKPSVESPENHNLGISTASASWAHCRYGPCSTSCPPPTLTRTALSPSSATAFYPWSALAR